MSLYAGVIVVAGLGLGGAGVLTRRRRLAVAGKRGPTTPVTRSCRRGCRPEPRRDRPQGERGEVRRSTDLAAAAAGAGPGLREPPRGPPRRRTRRPDNSLAGRAAGPASYITAVAGA